jgi:hypothetical protein
MPVMKVTLLYISIVFNSKIHFLQSEDKGCSNVDQNDKRTSRGSLKYPENK